MTARPGTSANRPGHTAGPVPVPDITDDLAAISFPDPKKELGALELPETWVERARLLEDLLRLFGQARGAVAKIHALAYANAEGTDQRRLQAAKLLAHDAQLAHDQLRARVVAYKLLIDVARDRDRLLVASMLRDDDAPDFTGDFDDAAGDPAGAV